MGELLALLALFALLVLLPELFVLLHDVPLYQQGRRATGLVKAPVLPVILETFQLFRTVASILSTSLNI